MKSSQQSLEEAKQTKLLKRKTEMAGMHSATVQRLLKSGVVVSPFLLRNTLSIEARNFGFELEPKNTFDSEGEAYISRIHVRCVQTGEKFSLEYCQWK